MRELNFFQRNLGEMERVYPNGMEKWFNNPSEFESLSGMQHTRKWK